jgi:hypothetical protein
MYLWTIRNHSALCRSMQCSGSTTSILRHSGVGRVADEVQYKFGLPGSHEIDIKHTYLHKEVCTCTPHLLGRLSTYTNSITSSNEACFMH